MEQKRNNKKPLIALATIALIGIIGGAFAYFTNTAVLPNVFRTQPFSTEVTEQFVSPTNWTPGTTTTKKIMATNTGGIDAAVRVYLEESWVDSHNNPLSLTQNGNRAAIINFTQNSNWTTSAEGGTTYYYYKNKLTNGESTTDLIDSVTFNSAITNSATCTSNNITGGKEVNCTSTGTGYDNATYTLTIHVETVQYDAYKQAWNTNVNIANSSYVPSP